MHLAAADSFVNFVDIMFLFYILTVKIYKLIRNEQRTFNCLKT